MKLKENHLYTNGRTAVIVNCVDQYHDSDLVDYSQPNRAGERSCTKAQFRKRYPLKVDRIVIEVELDDAWERSSCPRS